MVGRSPSCEPDLRRGLREGAALGLVALALGFGLGKEPSSTSPVPPNGPPAAEHAAESQGLLGGQQAAGSSEADNGPPVLYAPEGTVGASEPFGPSAIEGGGGGVGGSELSAKGSDGRSGGSSGRPPGVPSAGVDTSRACGERVDGASSAAGVDSAIGREMAIEFRVVGTKDTGRVTFLNSHDPYQGYFYVAVFPDDYDAFARPPAELFTGRCVVVRGLVDRYRGTPQIVLRHPEDIVIVGD